ncbi:hypothetical protein BLA29_007356, partial [Euroglyphus maynei]
MDPNQYFSRFRLWQLQFIYSEHNRLCGYIIRTDRAKWSMALCQFVIVGIPMNVCFMCVLIFGHPSASERLLYIFITVIHTFSMILPTASLAHVSYYIKGILPSISRSIPYLSHLRLKLKFDEHYGQLMHGEQYCFTFGYMGSVTYTTLSKALNSNHSSSRHTLRMFLGIRQFSYGQIKQLVERRNDRRLRLLHRLELTIIIIMIIRSMAIILMLRWPDTFPLY